MHLRKMGLRFNYGKSNFYMFGDIFNQINLNESDVMINLYRI